MKKGNKLNEKLQQFWNLKCVSSISICLFNKVLKYFHNMVSKVKAAPFYFKM